MTQSALLGDSHPVEGYIDLIRLLEDPSEHFPDPIADDDEMKHASGGDMHANYPPSKKVTVGPVTNLEDSATTNRDRQRSTTKTKHPNLQKGLHAFSRHAQRRARPFKSSPALKTIVSNISLTNMMRHSFSEVAEQAGDDTQKIVTQEYWGISNFEAGPRYGTGQASEQDEDSMEHQSRGMSDDLPQQLDLSLDPQSSNADSDDILTDPAENEHVRNFETPAARGRKRNSKGEIVKSDIETSATKTPGSAVTKMFAGVNGVNMSLTQVFQNTQAAATSPFGGLKSDPVFERPSPKLDIRESTPLAPLPFTSPKSVPGFTPLKSVGNDSIMISDEESDSDVSVDDDPNTIQKNIRSAIQVPMTSSRNKSTDSGERTQSSPTKNIDAGDIKGTREGGPRLTDGNNPCTDTHQTDRVTDSQYDTDSGHMKPPPRVPTSSILSTFHVSQSPYSQVMPVDLSKLGVETQKAMATSSPPRPPFEPSVDEDQERLPSSPPVIGLHQQNTEALEMHDEEMNKDDSSNQQEINPIASLLTNDKNNNSLVPMGVSSQGDLDRVDEAAPQMLQQGLLDEARKTEEVSDIESTSEQAQLDHTSTQPSDLQKKENSLNGRTQQSSKSKDDSTSAYLTAQSRVHDSYSADTASENTSRQAHSNVNPHKRLASIAAEPSQEEMDVANLDFTIIENSREELDLQKFSSPVRPSSRFKRQKKYSEAGLREHPKKSNFGRLGNAVQDKLQDMSGSHGSGNLPGHTSTSLSPEKQIERGVVVNSDKTNRNPKRKSMLGKLKRPEKFLKQIARISKRSTTSRNTSDIFEPEETQRSNLAESQITHAGSTLASTDHHPTPNDEDFITDPSQEAVLFPSRILAFCGAQYNASYPATVQKVFTRPSGPKMDVLFDDGSSAVLDADKWAFKLHFRAGDSVKVDLPGMKGKRYVVCGLKDRLPPGGIVDGSDSIEPKIKSTDIYGYQTVRVALKGPSSGSTEAQISSDTIDVPISAVKLDKWEFRKFEEDRNYQVLALPMPLSPMDTPKHLPRRLESPSSRSRRQTMSRDGHEDSVLSIVHPRSGVFTNMAFAVTFSQARDDDKVDCVKHITSNDGLLLDSGFEELFQSSASKSSTPMTTGIPASPSTPTTAEIGGRSLQLSAAAKGLGFTALIADTHSRRAKHMQALALNLPILHFRWVADCVQAKRILPWSKYLLPAGESSFLGGAIRSSSQTPYDPLSSSASLGQTLSRRNLLFADKTVLFITGKGRAEERRKAYSFLAMALGAESLGKVRDLAEAKIKLGTEKWDYVYVDGEAERGEQMLGNGEWKVVHDEFIVQSLILGAFPE